jgi:hypothetical protein
MVRGVLAVGQPIEGPIAAEIDTPNNVRNKPLYLAINEVSNGYPVRITEIELECEVAFKF